MIRYVGALFLLFLSLPAFTADSNPHWLQVQSPHFVVLTDSNEKQARRIAAQMEQMRAIFHKIVPNATADSDSPITILALKDRKSFQSLEPAAYLAKNQLELAGLFIKAADKNYILLRLDADGDHPFGTVYHEYTHLMTSKAPWVPLWLNEGLAEFYQNTTIRDKDVMLGQPSEDNILYLRETRLLPLTTILKVDYNSPYYHDEQKGSVFYAESWALTHYIVITDAQHKTTHLQDYMKLVAQGQDPVAAAQQAFGDLNKLQQELNYYVNQGNFLQFNMNAAVTADPASFQMRLLSQPEADAIRADVLINNNRSKEAVALLETCLRDDPNNALAHEAMGYLELRNNDYTAAKKWYGEAVQLNSQSYLANYYFGVISLRAGDRDHDDAVEASLRNSIKLNPNFAPSYDALANFLLARNKNLSEAHIFNVQAVSLDPANVSYRMNTATVLTQQHQFDNALSVLKAALPISKTNEETAMLQSRIDQLQKIQASFARSETPTQIIVQTASASSPNSSSNQTSAAPTTLKKTVVFHRVNGQVIGSMEDTPSYPAGDSKGPQHTIKGVLRDIRCSSPNVLSLKIDQAGKQTTLYTNDYTQVIFTTTYDSNDEIKPCTRIEDMKATVKFAEVTDKNVSGQILAIELSK